MADDDDDDDVDDIFPISLRLRDLLRQIADTITTCPGMRADVSTLRVMARSRTTCIDEEIDRLGPRSFYVSSISMKAAGSVPFLPVDQPHPRIATMILRPIDPLSTSPPPPPPPATTATLASSPNTTLLAGVLLLVDSTTTRVGHFVLGGGVRRGHDPRRPENRSLTFFRRRSPSSEGE
ncbi:hypothetical protein ALC57_03727 [Trachymyrmex cornetzi]|uniref:Uncharacterized protein n=1 Tax=Trachymyrmex cornetzi TaxID=471704 RepID=A0A151JLW3_9HYME|nr:hypothetical protein ALC57_03727 [Trachymyrmex cornetzi]